jgi:hypothetical protein
VADGCGAGADGASDAETATLGSAVGEGTSEPVADASAERSEGTDSVCADATTVSRALGLTTGAGDEE